MHAVYIIDDVSLERLCVPSHVLYSETFYNRKAVIILHSFKMFLNYRYKANNIGRATSSRSRDEPRAGLAVMKIG
jgi:hypothetical protein